MQQRAKLEEPGWEIGVVVVSNDQQCVRESTCGAATTHPSQIHIYEFLSSEIFYVILIVLAY